MKSIRANTPEAIKIWEMVDKAASRAPEWVLHRNEIERKYMPLFEVAFVRVPPIVEQEQGVSEKLLGGPYAVVAHDQAGAVANATLKLQKEAQIEFDSNVKILVRPFS